MERKDRTQEQLLEELRSARAEIATLRAEIDELTTGVGVSDYPRTVSLALLEDTDERILFSDSEGFPVYFNRAYAEAMKELLGLEMKPGIKPHELLPTAEAREVWEGFHRRVLSGEQFCTFAIVHRHSWSSQHFAAFDHLDGS